ncbi:hypothetical protein MAA_09739 [Metarhizium robertsii ARSEF 23]|uniref:Uncharacterized protein n=1 Tax=Metarhizium robertsii (strain ARSEF 23 / ATCC MYA-3075) TaxID=655844 RepID=E9FBU0_METRA|nr:uncharacterized protein MAA_09739 [Metarhizium robertsii ARSEF 23]EFY94806.1 hypothetical protein MAA_09739 [Metarhizium robertsii ARSEF 23]
MSSLRMVVLGSAVASASAIAGVHNNGTATGHIVYTTEVVTALTTYCPAPTTLTHGDKTYTITSATTLTITDCPCTISKPVQPTAVPTPAPGCNDKCQATYDQCRGKSGANLSTCVSDFEGCKASCTGATTAAPSKPVSPTVVPAPAPGCNDKCQATYDQAARRAAPSKPVSPTVVPAPAPGCNDKCQATYDQCRGKSGANLSTCVSDFEGCKASCTGATTAAPSKPVSPTVVPAPAPGCNDKCQATYDQCRGKSGANLSTCVSNFEGCKASCTGASAPAPPPAPAPTAAKPSGNSTTPVTAGAGALAPAKVLLALGAIALL